MTEKLTTQSDEERARKVVRDFCCDTCQFMDGCSCYNNIIALMASIRAEGSAAQTAPSREAVEAALHEWRFGMRGCDLDAMSSALTAALPHLAPQPSKGDEERARDIAQKRYDDNETIGWLTNAIARFAASIRAEGSAERAKLEEALRKYGHHDGLCNTRSNRFEDCNCGFDAALTMGASS
jgi:hypothetical protein